MQNIEENELTQIIELLKQLDDVQKLGVKSIVEGLVLTERETEKQKNIIKRKQRRKTK